MSFITLSPSFTMMASIILFSLGVCCKRLSKLKCALLLIKCAQCCKRLCWLCVRRGVLIVLLKRGADQCADYEACFLCGVLILQTSVLWLRKSIALQKFSFITLSPFIIPDCLFCFFHFSQLLFCCCCFWSWFFFFVAVPVSGAVQFLWFGFKFTINAKLTQ